MLRILIADDHEVARHGIRALLEAHPAGKFVPKRKTGARRSSSPAA